MKHLVIAVAAAFLAAPAFAQDTDAAALTVSGDAAAGEEQFKRQCVACHVVTNDDGEMIAGRNMKTGPNLYGVALRPLGSVEGFRYGDAIVEAGEAGMTWTEENFAGYVQDPTPWLRTAVDDKGARGKMAYKVRSETDALDLYAYLVSVGPEIAANGAETEEAAPSN